MRIVTIFLVVAAMALSTMVAFQWRAVREAKVEAAALRAENDARAARPQQDATTSEELDRLRGETRDLPKLRNQVRHLRSEIQQLTQARTENERLRQAIQSAPTNSVADSRVPTLPGFTSREALVEAGLATPEAAVQSFFRAMRDGDIPRFMQCIAPEFRKDFTEDMDEHQIGKLGEKLKEEMAAFSNFRIVERKEISPDHIQLGLQSSVGPSVMRVGVRKIGNDWLMDKPF